jgi:mitochondrial-processing peptidase subunit alpha
MESFSMHEYPWATEAPVITRTTAAEAAAVQEEELNEAKDGQESSPPSSTKAAVQQLKGVFSSSKTSLESLEASSVSSSTSSSSNRSMWTTMASAVADVGAHQGVDVDAFDDVGILSPTEREQRRLSQRSTLNTSLEQPLVIAPTVPPHVPSNVSSSQLAIPETQLTTLDNGVRVVSQETYGQVSTVGMVSDFGSRYESPSTTGLTHLLELSAFGAAGGGSPYTSSAADVAHALQQWGGSRYASSGREQSVHAIDLLRPNVAHAVRLLADVTLRPLFVEHEFNEAKQAIRFAASAPELHLPPELLLAEALQSAAYGADSQLGRSYLCPPEMLDVLTPQIAFKYWQTNFVQNPAGLVLGGAGVPHQELVALAQEHFGHLVQNEALANRSVPSVYKGGESHVTLPMPEQGSDGAKEELSVVSTEQRLTRVALALEVGGWHSPDLVAVCVLQTLLGGGSSFSAGGPGKGMYSRLYRQVLNMYRWAESTEAFTAFHNESGLLGIAGSAPAEHVPQMMHVLATHFTKLANERVSDEELSRARNMLKNNVLTQLESRLILFEDMARQVLTYGKREPARITVERIEAITASDIQDLVQRALRQPPTVAAVGVNVANVPSQAQVMQMLQR